MSLQRPLSVVALVLAVVVLSAGCLSGLGGSDSGDDIGSSSGTGSAEELQTAATETMDEVETYSFVMDVSIDSSQGDVEMHMEGVADIGAEKMRAETAIDGAGGSVDVIQYLIEDTQYAKIQGSWYRQDVPYTANTTWQQHQLANQQALLENATLEIVENRTFDGHDVHVVDMDVSPGFAKEQMLEYQELTQNEAASAIESVSVENFELTMYIDAETHHIRYTEAEMQYTVDGIEADMSMRMTVDNFDEPVDIELPEEAEDAGELSS